MDAPGQQCLPAQPEERPEARRPVRRQELALLAVCILLLLLGTLPPLLNLGRYQGRIAGAISRALGRPVSMDSISLQLLPWPAFRLQNLAVGEDPGFGQEPALRAPEVVLEPSLTSLWRGRFEISKVELSDASVNLVRAPDGRWNISSILLQASHIPNAPTGRLHAGAAPRFPYIEASDTRINFKRGVEKLPYSILNADFSMWLAQPGIWQLRLQGQPARTDLMMTSGDTGVVRLEGEIHRASALGSMPIALTGEWSHAPLGQMGRLLLGRDLGWRGDTDLRADFRGEINALSIRSHLVIDNLHRQEFTPEESFSLDTTCRGHYSRAQPDSDAFLCRWPVGDGALTLESSAVTPTTPRALTLGVAQVPVSFIAATLGLLRSGAPPASLFTGTMQGSLGYGVADRQIIGAVRAPSLGIEGAAADGATLTVTGLVLSGSANAPAALRLRCDPLPLGVASAPMTLAGQFSARRYMLDADGAAALDALDTAASALHLPGFRHLTDGLTGSATARVALTASGTWLGGPLSGPGGGPFESAAAHATGTVHLANVVWQPGWLPIPVRIPAANLALSQGSARWNVPTAELDAGSPLVFSLNAQQALDCTAAGAGCETQFSLSTPSLSTAALQAVFAGGHHALLSALLAQFDPARVHLPALRGSLHVNLFTIGKLPVRNASALLSTAVSPQGAPLIRMESLDGRALGGALHLSGSLTASGSAPEYSVDASLSGASAAQAAALWHENWRGGTLGGTASFTVSGDSASDLLGSAKGRFQASWQGGSLGPALPHFASWDTSGVITGSGLSVQKGALSGTPATLSGTIGWDRSLALELTPTPDAEKQAITGTLDSPVAAQPPDQP